ncbi:hypothetical protein [Haloferula sp. BvORR071]|uniref:hypothetical protein n=1 Tax=Haloferula sp. BvORR071 TaxID=1396141 RepID=UPI00054FEE59|nr:hypothetical protein [Haloferula sp. BvORR071]
MKATAMGLVTLILSALVILAVAALVHSPSGVQPPSHVRPPSTATTSGAKLKSAKIVFDTPAEDDKDADTKISVTLFTKEKGKYKRIVASKNDFDGDTDYEAPSRHEKELDIQGEITRAQVGGLRVVIEIQPMGLDTWIFSYKVQLNFDDGTTLERAADSVKLKEDDRKHERTY